MEHPTRVGKYEIEQFLGGGMSHVYKAKDSVLGRRVALKMLTQAGMGDPEAKARFLLEARMASNISHENIIAVYDFGEDQGRPFIVMEYLEGESLRDAIKHQHTGDYTRRMRTALQIARALDHIHGRKIIHRDIKPENINIDLTGKVKLMDFGIAKSEGVQLTRAGFTLGTPFYMAPEQVLGRPVTPQADVYAYGILLFELLTGQKPITGQSIEQIFQSILYEPVNVAPLLAQHIPKDTIELVSFCTAKQVTDRAPNLSYVCDAIENILDPSKPKPSRSGTGAQQIPQSPAPPQAQRPAGTGSQPVGNQPTVQQPTYATQATNAQPSTRTSAQTAVPTSSRIENLPGFLGKLPGPFRSQGGLMLLAGAFVLLLMFSFIGILYALRMI